MAWVLNYAKITLFLKYAGPIRIYFWEPENIYAKIAYNLFFYFVFFSR